MFIKKELYHLTCCITAPLSVILHADPSHMRVILEKAVESRKYAQALGAPGKFKKALITNKGTTCFLNFPCTPI